MSIKKLLSDSLYTFISTGISRAVFILVSLFSAKYLTQADFQNLSILMSTVNMIIASLGFAFGTTLLKKAVEHNEDENDKYKKCNLESLISAIVLILLSLGLISFLMLTHISELLFVGDKKISIFMIVTAIAGVGATAASYLIVSLEKFTDLSKIKFISSIFFMMWCAFVLLVDDISIRFDILLILYLALFIVQLVWYAKKYWGYGGRLAPRKPTLSHRNGIVDIAWPAFLSNFTYAVIMWFQMIIIYQVSGDREIASKVAVALTWYNAIVFIPQILSSVLLPKLLKSKGADFKEHMFRGSIINMISVGLAVIAIMLLSNYIDQIYAEQFNSLSALVILMSLSAFPNALCKLSGQYFLANDKMRVGFRFNLFWGVIYSCLTYILMPIYNEYSVGIGLITSYMLLFGSQLIYFRRLER
ncbi:hypothetical protein [Vibrio sp. PNB22_4_1]